MRVRLDRFKMFKAMDTCGMTQTEVARHSGVSRAVVNSVYNGKSCSDETGRKIADALGVTVESLLEDKAQ